MAFPCRRCDTRWRVIHSELISRHTYKDVVNWLHAFRGFSHAFGGTCCSINIVVEIMGGEVFAQIGPYIYEINGGVYNRHSFHIVKSRCTRSQRYVSRVRYGQPCKHCARIWCEFDGRYTYAPGCGRITDFVLAIAPDISCCDAVFVTGGRYTTRVCVIYKEHIYEYAGKDVPTTDYDSDAPEDSTVLWRSKRHREHLRPEDVNDKDTIAVYYPLNRAEIYRGKFTITGDIGKSLCEDGSRPDE